MQRRTLLSSAAAVLSVASTAGCGMIEGDDAGVVIGDVVIDYNEGDPVSIELTLERDGAVVLDETAELTAGNPVVFEASWPQEPATFDLRYTVDGPEREEEGEEQYTSTEQYMSDGDCAVLFFLVGAPGQRSPRVTLENETGINGGTCGGD